MKICFFANSENVHMQRVAAALAQRGHQVHVVCHNAIHELLIPGVTVERFSVPGPGPINPYRWNKRSTRYLQSFFRRFDVVVVLFLQEWGLTPQITEGGCLVAFPQGSDIVPPPGEKPPPSELVAKRIALLHHADLVGVTCTRFARVVAAFAGLDADEIGALPLGVDLEQFQPVDPPAKTRKDELRVGYFKGFREVYGPTYLMQAIPRVLERLPEVKFDLVGDGPQLARCQEMAVRDGVEQSIRWIGRQPHGKIARLLCEWDLTVMPSLCESFGVAALESSAMRVPVVASNVGGLPAVVRDGETGLLVPPESPDALAHAMLTLLCDSKRRSSMGEAGRMWVETQFQWPNVLDQWERTLQCALDRSRGNAETRPSRRGQNAPVPYGRVSVRR